MLRRLVLLIAFAFIACLGAPVTQVKAQGSILDSKKSNNQIDNAKYVFELFVLDKLPPGVSDFVGLVKESANFSRVGLVKYYQRKQTEAGIAGDWDKAERYYALITCLNIGDCAAVRRYRAQSKAKHKSQIKTPKQKPSPLGQLGKKGAFGGIMNTGQPPAPPCADGQAWCYKGAYGGGGCYSKTAQICVDGLRCRKSYFACKLPGEPAYCEKAFQKCKSKKSPCPPNQTLCPPGPNGKGRCIGRNESCFQGLVCKKGSCICKLPGVPKYCAPCGAICQPRPKPPVKLPSPCRSGLTFCPPGIFGKGACINSYQSCIKGLVCPLGYFYCKLPGEAAYCSRPGSRCVSRIKPAQQPVLPPPPPIFQPPARCQPPRIWCPAGAFGSGRCYVRGAQRCIRGMICAAGFKTCKRPGQRRVCIPANQPCLMPQTPVTPPVFQPPSRCRPPQIWCPAGRYGGGGCYLPGVTRCIRGKTCPGGFKICKIRGERARCIPAMGMCLAQKRPAPPQMTPPKRPPVKAPSRLKSGRCGVFNKFCPGGRYGGGGCYSPNRQNCLQGKICSRGTVLCKPKGETVRCIRRGTACKAKQGKPVSKPASGPTHKDYCNKNSPHYSAMLCAFGMKNIGGR